MIIKNGIMIIAVTRTPESKTGSFLLMAIPMITPEKHTHNNHNKLATGFFQIFNSIVRSAIISETAKVIIIPSLLSLNQSLESSVKNTAAQGIIAKHKKLKRW